MAPDGRQSVGTDQQSGGRVAQRPRIGFVGLGNMGGPMCRRLVGAGYEVIAFDIDHDAIAVAVAGGAVAAESAADCAGRADVFMTSLPRPDHVETVMTGDDGALAALRSGSVWVDLTTNRKDLVIQLASAAPDGVEVVDSPVTGAVDGARTGKLTLFVGGDTKPVDAVTPILDHLGLVIACGPLGTGNVVKLVTNQLWFVAAAAIGEGFATGLANGVELGTLWHAIKESVGRQLRRPPRCTEHLRRPLRPVVLTRPVSEGSRPARRTQRTGRNRPADDDRRPPDVPARLPTRTGPTSANCTWRAASKTKPSCQCVSTATGSRTGRSDVAVRPRPPLGVRSRHGVRSDEVLLAR